MESGRICLLSDPPFDDKIFFLIEKDKRFKLLKIRNDRGSSTLAWSMENG